MNTTVYFVNDMYGNYLDNYYTDKYTDLINHFISKSTLTWSGNLGISDGVLVMNNFKGDFTKYNCAVVDHPTQGLHIYKIIKKEFVRKDVWNITMVKDLFSSRYNDAIMSDVLVSRLGIDRTKFDPILFIEEQMKLSEVKKQHLHLSEIPNKRAYGYLLMWKRDSLDGKITWQSTTIPTQDYDIRVNSLNDLPFVKNGKSVPITTNDTRYLMSMYGANENLYRGVVLAGTDPATRRKIHFDYTLYMENKVVTNKDFRSRLGTTLETGAFEIIGSGANPTDHTVVLNRMENVVASAQPVGEYVIDYSVYNGKIVFDASTGKYYDITMGSTSTVANRRFLTLEETGALFGLTTTQISAPDSIRAYVQINESLMTFNLTPLPYVEEALTHTFQLYNNTVDQPFQMQYIPIIEGVDFKYGDGTYTTSRMSVEYVLYDLISRYAGNSGKLVDIQIIPYCPIDGFINGYNEEDEEYFINSITGAPVAKDVITLGGNIIPVFEVGYASYDKFIPLNIAVTDYKLSQQERYTLTSPSGASNYSFSLAKNNGLTGFKIGVDLRPYASYHIVQPIFNGLYGTNFQDTRGLVWQEDTSMTMITDAWETYKRENINYLNSFNAEQDFQRSNLSINQQANWGNYGFDAGKRMIEAGVEATTFAMDAVAKDVWFGAKGAGTGAGGATAIMVGAVASEALDAGQLAYNNHMDTKILDNQLENSRKQFNYSLGNIQALPENIEKVAGNFGSNNFIPYLQIFTPTDDEIDYFNNYLNLYGVNVGMLVNLNGKQFNYLQGTILRYAGQITNEEYAELCRQITKGVRKYGW
jgi:hypothetical protein